ncbi:MAG: hypothetical protein KDJ26_08890 [Alphaproteobacteria bacterium]|nr:hypothetical protein [Alphaproteobacteria bacterium]MCB1552095.1 hypothetical protein [Alphaproteobacteria bacterium]MCB9984877.1 hypothetical protein [Micavibrio sp.]HPQ50757.1 hypothetical protein [Alphaproteobacteria bacterium]HRK97269.1 hypothetical protein [Alphaproteobacteria bacterium]
MSDEYYNIVLIPDNIFARKAVSFAQEFFLDFQDGYCLSDVVFPHITLGQFKSNDRHILTNIREKLLDVSLSVVIQFKHMYIRRDVLGKKSYLWIGLEVQKTEDLSQVQAEVHKILNQSHLLPLNRSLENFWPHMTFARINEQSLFPPFCFPAEVIDFVGSDWKIEVGYSDCYGQFLGDKK